MTEPNPLVSLYPSSEPTAAASPGASGAAALYPSAGAVASVQVKGERPAAPAVDVPATAVELSQQCRRILADVRHNEPPGAGWQDFARLFPTRMGPADGAEVRDAIARLIPLRIGFTQVAAVVRIARACQARGEAMLSERQALEVLRETWGDETTGNVEIAKAMARRITKRWPGFADFLKLHALGNHPAMVALLYQKAKQDEARR